MNSLAASILAFLVCMVLFSPRRWAWLGMSAGVLYLTQGQYVEQMGLRLYPLRFLELAGFVRIVARREFSFSRMNGIDWSLVALYSYTTIVFLLRSSEGQAYQIGLAVDAILCYFIFRALIGSVDEFRWFLSVFLLLLAPYLALVSVEWLTGHNPFAFMGGIQEGVFSRGGRPRCWGSFRHPVLLGSFGASFLPLYIGLFFADKNRTRAIIGASLCIGLILFSNSGGPLAAAVVVMIGWLLWTVRSRMQWVRRGIVATIVVLAIVMKAPVWYVLARVSSITGGTGDHRSYLIDTAIKHLGSWWLAGLPVSETSSWFSITIDTTGGMDITNQYLSFGLAAGLGALGLLVFLSVRAFSSLGKALTVVRSTSLEPVGAEFILWGLAVTLSVHVTNWLGVIYFDQMYAIWFMQLAAISSLTEIFAEPVYVETEDSASVQEGTS